MIWETYVRRIRQTSLNIIQTRIESVREKDITKTGVRVYDGEHIGTAGAIGAYETDDLHARAKFALKRGIRYDFPPSGPIAEHMDRSVVLLEHGQLVSEFDMLLNELRSDQPKFIFSNKINLTNLDVAMKNEMGLDLAYKDTSLAVALLFKEKASPNIMDGYVVFESRRYDRDTLIEYINAVCRAFQTAKPLPTGTRHPVIFSTQQGLPLRKLAEDLDGNRFGSKASLLSERAHERTFNEAFTLYQSRNPEDIIAPFFDAEGIVNSDYRFRLIDRGVVVAPFTDKRVASKYGLQLTGSAAAEYDGVPFLATPEFKIQESDESVLSLLAGRPAIFIFIASGGDFTPDGTFGTPVQLAFLYDGTELLGRLPEFNLSSNVFDMFGKDFIGVGSDPYFSLSDERCLIMEMDVSRL